MLLKMLLANIKTSKSGNISVLTMAVTIFFSFLFLLIFDSCQIFAARESTKNASDAASLAVAQNLIFFEDLDCRAVASEIAEKNNCVIIDCVCSYDEVVVTAEKKLNFILLDKVTSKYNRVQSISKVKVIYPWDSQFGFCKYYKFGYKDI